MPIQASSIGPAKTKTKTKASLHQTSELEFFFT
jgi:hypothetical protein